MNKKNFEKICFFLFCMYGISTNATIFDVWDTVKNRLGHITWKIEYSLPYITVPLTGVFVALCTHKKIGALCMGGYAAYSTFSNMYMLYTLKQKYAKKEITHDGWYNNSQGTLFYFARWRQHNQGDGMYWTTAWQLQQEIDKVKDQFLRDLYAGKFVILNALGQRIFFPTPQQVFAAIENELQELAYDKKLLRPLTDINYAYVQPEEFHPDVSFMRILWPNYNAASWLYIELDVMMKRLEKLKNIVAELRSGLGNQGWLKIKNF